MTEMSFDSEQVNCFQSIEETRRHDRKYPDKNRQSSISWYAMMTTHEHYRRYCRSITRSPDTGVQSLRAASTQKRTDFSK